MIWADCLAVIMTQLGLVLTRPQRTAGFISVCTHLDQRTTALIEGSESTVGGSVERRWRVVSVRRKPHDTLRHGGSPGGSTSEIDDSRGEWLLDQQPQMLSQDAAVSGRRQRLKNYLAQDAA